MTTRPSIAIWVGVGLAVARRTAQGLGGDLRVDSAPGRGTLVEARVPIPVRSPEGPNIATAQSSLVET